MNNADLLIVFFGMLGLVCLLIPKLIVVFYQEITNLASDASKSKTGKVASSVPLYIIRIIGIGLLSVVGRVYFF